MDNTITLRFKSPFLSITELDTINIPSFAVICGLNGTGKTHLLKAIAQKNIEIVRDNKVLSASQLIGPIEPQFEFKASYPRNGSMHGQFGGPWDRVTNLQASISSLNIIPKLLPNLNRDTEDFVTLLRSRSYVTDDKQLMHAEVFATTHEWRQLAQAPLFQLQAASNVLSYKLRKEANFYRWCRQQREKDGPAALSDEEFCAKYGSAPLEVINRTLKGVGFRLIELTSPENPLEVELALENDRGIRIDPSALSSGENIVLALVAAMLHDAHVGVFPDVLLLDEVAAFLHPCAIGEFVRQIQQVFVENAEVSVLLVTHAPTLVALCPEGSTFIMQRDSPRLRPCSRDEAIGHLTAGVPSLRIEPSNCRQVFVESENDARHYQSIYKLCSAKLQPSIGLTFIPSGAGAGAKKSGDCVTVRAHVQALFKGGSRTIRGIVDWDKINEPSPVVHVLGHGERYAIDNAIADPLLVALLLIKLCPHEMTSYSGTFRELNPDDVSLMQRIADEVSTRVLNSLQRSTDSPRKTQYASGLALSHPKAYLETRGHDVVGGIIRAFPQLNQHIKQCQEALLREVVEHVMPEFLGLIPQVFTNLFVCLQADVSSDGGSAERN